MSNHELSEVKGLSQVVGCGGGVQSCCKSWVHSTTSATTQEVSSFLPPLPMGASAKTPLGKGLVFA